MVANTKNGAKSSVESIKSTGHKSTEVAKSTGHTSGNSIDIAEKPRRFGDLHRYSDAAYLRPATADEYAESRAAGFEGVIMVDGVACYVE